MRCRTREKYEAAEAAPGVPAIPNDASDTMHDDGTGFPCAAAPQ